MESKFDRHRRVPGDNALADAITHATAARFCRELEKRHVTYELRIVRDEALMLSVAVPGERWEMEVFDDGRIELERFISQGVVEAPGVVVTSTKRAQSAWAPARSG